MTGNFEDRARIVAGQIAKDLDDELQEAADSAGWDSPVSVDAKAGVISLSYLQSDAANIFNSEYGREGVSPNSVIRPFMVKAEPAIKNAIGAEALDYLFMQGILP